MALTRWTTTPSILSNELGNVFMMIYKAYFIILLSIGQENRKDPMGRRIQSYHARYHRNHIEIQGNKATAATWKVCGEHQPDSDGRSFQMVVIHPDMF
jgi:hypothetical protein